MKQIVFSIAAMLLLSTAAMAQDDRGQRPNRQGFDRTEMIQRRTDGVVKKYGLNEEQARQLLSLNTKFADMMGPRGGARPGNRGARPGGDGQRAARRDTTQQARQRRPQMGPRMGGQMGEQMKAYEEELQKIMTPEQYKAYKADQEERMKQGRPQGPRPQRN